MKKYSQLIQLPVKYPTKADQKAFKEENRSLDKYRKKEYIVTASVAEETLIVNIFEQDANASRLVFRHFYDKTDKKYITQKVDKGKKGTGAIYTYCWDCLCIYADGAETVILDYLGAAGCTGLQAIDKEEQEILGAKRQKRYDKITRIIDERMAVISDKPPAAFFDWIRDTVYLNERYFIYTRTPKAKEQSGACSFCKTAFSAPAKNGKTTVCPKCGSVLRCCSRGRCGDEIDYWHNVSYVERVTDTDGKPAIVERVFYTKSTIAHIQNWETSLDTEIYTSEVERRFYDPENEFSRKSNAEGEYHYTQDVFLQSGVMRWCSNNQGNPCWRGGISMYPDNLNSIVRGADCRLKNVDLSVIARNCTSNFSKLYAALLKFPVIENLVKQGLTNLAGELTDSYDEYFFEPCYYRSGGFRKHTKADGRSAAEFLCVSRPEIAQFAQINITSREYSIYMEAKETFGTSELDDVHALCAEYDEHDDDALIETMKYGVRPQKIMSYLAKQEKLRGSNDSLAITFRDYLKAAKKLYGSLNADTRYPADLVKEHDRITAILKEKKDEIQMRMLARRVKLLKEFEFSDKEFAIFPLRTVEDFINESRQLKHCVKTYIDRCAEGSTNIFALRRTEEPEKPYFTVNIANDGHLIQNRGFGNCPPPDEVKRFVNKWLKLVKKKLTEISLDLSVKLKTKTANQLRIGA